MSRFRGYKQTAGNRKDSWFQHHCSSCISYELYARAQIRVLEGKALDAHDKFSLDLQPLQSEQDWKDLVQQAITDAEILAGMIEALPDGKLGEDFTEEKYGNYYRNFIGLIEHCHLRK